MMFVIQLPTANAGGPRKPKLTPDQQQKVQEMHAKFPHAIHHESGVRAKWTGKIPHCMKCGALMRDRSQYKRERGAWVPRKSKGRESCWECETCHAGQGAN